MVGRPQNQQRSDLDDVAGMNERSVYKSTVELRCNRVYMYIRVCDGARVRTYGRTDGWTARWIMPYRWQQWPARLESQTARHDDLNAFLVFFGHFIRRTNDGRLKDCLLCGVYSYAAISRT